MHTLHTNAYYTLYGRGIRDYSYQVDWSWQLQIIFKQLQTQTHEAFEQKSYTFAWAAL